MKKLLFFIAAITPLLTGCLAARPIPGLARHDLDYFVTEYARARDTIIAAKQAIPPEDFQRLAALDAQITHIYNLAIRVDSGNAPAFGSTIGVLLDCFTATIPLIAEHLSPRDDARLAAIADVLKVWRRAP